MTEHDARAAPLLARFGLAPEHPGASLGPGQGRGGGGAVTSINPTNGRAIGVVKAASAADLDAAVASAALAARAWRDVPAPRRGEAVRQFGLLLREHKDALGSLVAL